MLNARKSNFVGPHTQTHLHATHTRAETLTQRHVI